MINTMEGKGYVEFNKLYNSEKIDTSGFLVVKRGLYKYKNGKVAKVEVETRRRVPLKTIDNLLRYQKWMIIN